MATENQISASLDFHSSSDYLETKHIQYETHEPAHVTSILTFQFTNFKYRIAQYVL